MCDSAVPLELGRLVIRIKALVNDVGKEDAKEERIDSLANELLEAILDVPPLDCKNDLHCDAQSEIETAAVRLWNFAVAKKTRGGFSSSLNAKVRHVAFKMVYFCNAMSNEEATLRKLVMMGLKTARAWLDCSNPSMSDSPLSMTEEFIGRLQMKVESTLAAGGDADSENLMKKKTANQRDLFKVICYQAEAACGQNQNEQALKLVQQARDMLVSCPNEGVYVTMLCFNFGVDEFQRGQYESSISWLRLSFDIGKTNNNATPKNQARTLRLLANAYLEWDSREHWQKALNAIGLANSEHSHPAGSYLKLRILLEGEAPDDRLKAAVDEMLRHSELTVDLGNTTLRLISKYKRHDICFEGLNQLSRRFDTSLDLGSIWSTHVELLLSNNQMAEGSDAAEGYITAHNTNKPMDVDSQKQFHILFWDAAAKAFESNNIPEALKWYNYSLSLFGSVDEVDCNLAKLHRNRAACYIALEQLDQAAMAVTQAEKCDPTSAHTYYFKYKVALLRDEDNQALEALNKMYSCRSLPAEGGASADGLTTAQGPTLHGLISLSAHLAMERSKREVALAALEGLVQHPSCPQQLLTASRCLVRLRLSLLDQPGADSNEIHTVMNNIEQAYNNLKELVKGGNSTGVDINDEGTWFMKIAWNLALRCGEKLEEMHQLYMLCYKLNRLCTSNIAGLNTQKTCLLMAAASLLQVQRSKGDKAEQRDILNKVVDYVNECNEVLSLIEKAQIAETGTASADSTTPILLILYEFEARLRLGTPGLEDILERAISLPKAEAKTFETIAALAMELPLKMCNISVRALKVAIKKHLQVPTVDYKKCSKAFHSLVELALDKGSALDTKDEAWGYYMDVIHVIETAKDQYPEMEIVWLMTKAWNCGINHYSGAKYEEARRWCELAMGLLKHLTALRKNYDHHMNSIYSEILDKVDSCRGTGSSI